MRVRLTRDIPDPAGESDEPIPAGTIVEVHDLTVETLDGGFCFSVTAASVEAVLPNFEDLGFERWKMDGGAVAYGMDLSDSGRYILVTDACGNLPADKGEVLVGIYDPDDDAQSEVCSYPSIEAAIRALQPVLAAVPA